GTFTAVLDYGTYFWREIKAPSGYKAMDNDYHKFRVIKGLPEYRFVVENEAVPYTPGGGGSSYQIEIKKVDKETRETLAGALFEIWSSKLAEDGVTLIPDKKLLEQNVITGQYGVVTISVDHKGTFFYREVKAPVGYECDGEYYAVEIKGNTRIQRITVTNKKQPVTQIKLKKNNEEKRIVIYEGSEKVPKTGSKNELCSWIILIFLSMAGLRALTQRKEEANENL
ncbi:MAG: SpaA isopeptide-forming pilin-related protein, partial [Bacillota bacterium]|nr:SpaA isopeptide-forming pilin-related protein [Bacillota bacterium]